MADFCLLRRRCPPKLVKFYVKPLINFIVDSMVLVADLLGRALLFHGLRLGGGAILVSPAYVNSVVTPEPAVSREHVGAEHTADDVPEVGDVIDIRKCAGDQYVAAAGNRQLRQRRRGRRHRDRRV